MIKPHSINVHVLSLQQIMIFFFAKKTEFCIGVIARSGPTYLHNTHDKNTSLRVYYYRF